MLGLSIHSVLAGVALAASVAHGSHDGQLAGLGTFLAIVLHKPFDALTIALLMERGGWRPPARHLVNSLFALAIPLGAALFHLGIYGFEPGETSARSPVLAYALAFSAGTFFCIAMSDLLPELQFHRHDRVKLSLALLLGVAVAYGAQRLESGVHGHTPAPPEQDSQGKILTWSYPYCLLSPDPVGAGRVRLGGRSLEKAAYFSIIGSLTPSRPFVLQAENPPIRRVSGSWRPPRPNFAKSEKNIWCFCKSNAKMDRSAGLGEGLAHSLICGRQAACGTSHSVQHLCDLASPEALWQTNREWVLALQLGRLVF